jgi:radical SAM family uncharacterized protein/radical SAM-linked protein
VKNKEIKEILDRYILPYVEKPARYIGNETNIIRKNLRDVDLRFALAFPDLYELAMSSQSIEILYHLLNRHEYVWAERVFAPWVDMEEQMRTYQVPLFSLESYSPLYNFDVIGFTLQYELTYTNILNMLDLAQIPLFSKQRDNKDPIILAGGPCSCNPEPLSDFIDAFYIGDAESGIDELCTTLREAKKEGLKRQEILNRLAKIRGVYVPVFYEASYNLKGNYTGLKPKIHNAPVKIKTQIIPKLVNENYCFNPLIPLIEVTHDRLSIEVMRGCTEGCRYCNAGMIYRPLRERSADDVLYYAKKALANSGYNELSFLSLSITDYSDLITIMRNHQDMFAKDHVNISFPSMRLDSFSEEIAEFAKSVRKSGFTFAPEAGSQRLRKVINKNISDEDLLKSVKIALDNGWKTLKFYFMIGLPTETKEDVESIAKQMRCVVETSRGYGKIQFKVSISPFSPKSHTPFQWEKQDSKEEFDFKINLLKNLFKSMRQVKLSWRNPALSELECILGRADRRFAKVIHSAWKNGSKFDGWDDLFCYDAWHKAFKHNDVSSNEYTQEIPDHHPLPWEHIDKGVTRNFLKKERKYAYDQVTTTDCKSGTCHACGIQRKNGFSNFTDCYIEPNLDQKTYSQISTFKKATKISKKNSPLPLKSVFFRVEYKKLDFARFVSHLDVMRIFERACRRAQIRLVYSKGFNPHPKLSFSPALSLGFTSEAEYVDVEILDSQDSDLSMKQRLNAVLPDGIKISAIRKITSKVTSLSSTINMAEYQIGLGDRKISKNSIEKVQNHDAIIITRKIKGVQKSLDIRPFIGQMWKDNGSLLIHTFIDAGRTVRIEEILAQLFGTVGKEFKAFPVHRKRQLVKVENTLLTPMDII